VWTFGILITLLIIRTGGQWKIWLSRKFVWRDYAYAPWAPKHQCNWGKYKHAQITLLDNNLGHLALQNVICVGVIKFSDKCACVPGDSTIANHKHLTSQLTQARAAPWKLRMITRKWKTPAKTHTDTQFFLSFPNGSCHGALKELKNTKVLRYIEGVAGLNWKRYKCILNCYLFKIVFHIQGLLISWYLF